MLGIAILEGVSTLLFGGVSQLIDAVLPDVDLDLEAELDLDTDVDSTLMSSNGSSAGGPLTRSLAWMRVGQVPILVLVVVFLTAFGLLGLTIQAALATIGFGVLPGSLAAVPAFALSLPMVRILGGWIGKLVPREETSAVSSDSFEGRVAQIVLGTARIGQPAQARLRDEHGKTHYVLVEPDLDDQELTSDVPILLVKRSGSRFRAIPATSQALLGPLNS